MPNRRDRIRMLNDQLRKTHTGGSIVVTEGIRNVAPAFLQELDEALSIFSDFNTLNDPYGEHDFGVVTMGSMQIAFKIDYYDLDLRHLSEDPSDPEVTRRVMTIMLLEEY